MIIGICGLISCGKGTVADILVDEHNFKKISFADKLKDAVSLMFDWPRDMLEGETPDSRYWREQEDKFWTEETGRSVTPRLVLQEFGTDCMRNGFYDGIWVSFVKENRQIYIKLNASGYGKVTVPNLIYKTRRQAIPTLEALGFKIGQITYKPNIAENTVLEMRYNGATLEPGSQLSKTSTIDLVLADGNNPSAIEQPTNNE